MQKITVQIYTAVFVAALLLNGCKTATDRRMAPPPPLSSLQRATMQTKEMNGDFATAFSATISVLQDEGWQLDVVDRASGIIQASSLKRQDSIGPAEDWFAGQDATYRETQAQNARKNRISLPEWTRWERLTAHIEQWGPGTVRIRLTIITCGSVASSTFLSSDKNGSQTASATGGTEQSRVIENPATYQYLFQKIQRAVFVREGLQGR